MRVKEATGLGYWDSPKNYINKHVSEPSIL